MVDKILCSLQTRAFILCYHLSCFYIWFLSKPLLCQILFRHLSNPIYLSPPSFLLPQIDVVRFLIDIFVTLLDGNFPVLSLILCQVHFLEFCQPVLLRSRQIFPSSAVYIRNLDSFHQTCSTFPRLSF